MHTHKKDEEGGKEASIDPTTSRSKVAFFLLVDIFYFLCVLTSLSRNEAKTKKEKKDTSLNWGMEQGCNIVVRLEKIELPETYIHTNSF